ncbi:helix-turn-helix domain-containing protein [Sphingobium sp. CCH11-B1]|uniref:helix-turn-helix domain-containing protein n=1 Tax=Sphingobium sp. CCH11-B1 TaxID=1768781 RepID=UPI00082A83C3|nr:helix-turn-helix transcriptional regulator [Sphingobium sp. CCH11-B1]
MGQIVPYVKDNVSSDLSLRSGHNRLMTQWPEEAQFNDMLCARTARLRVEREWTQAQMATAIGVPLDRYKKYETRSPLPPYLIPRFAMVVDRSVSYILTGKDEAVARGPRRLVRTAANG